MSTFRDEFIAQIILRINENPPRISTCLDLLTEDQVWYRKNDTSNSIGNLILHLCGNIRQYSISTLAEATDTRNRPLEFSTEGGWSKDQLIKILTKTVDEATYIAQNLSEDRLSQSFHVQCFDLSGVGILIHVAEHFSYHTGQIAILTKFLVNKDLRFYDNSTL
jgi:uncharacterized damage-inducible protein DinB